MRRLHLVVGVCAVVAFLITGQFMRHHSPPMATMSDSARLMYRSRHIYILAAGLAQSRSGSALPAAPRRLAQSGSGGWFRLTPRVSCAADCCVHRRTRTRLSRGNAWSHAGLYALFAGSIAHFACGAATSRKSLGDSPLARKGGSHSPFETGQRALDRVPRNRQREAHVAAAAETDAGDRQDALLVAAGR